MRKVILLLVLACITLARPAFAADEGQKVTVEQGTLGLSKIMVAVPAKWNKHVLIYAHGLRPATDPLSAEFSVNDPLNKILLDEGWLIAETSYRRNGWIVDDAITDLSELRQHVIDKYGKPERIYLCGGSMGGAIVTKMAETCQGQYDGALAVGAALNFGAVKYSFTPEMPLLFISNQNELAGPRQYLAKLGDVQIKPALWYLKRDGHCNLNAPEELAALRALFAYRETGKIEDNKDATIILTPQSVARFADGGAYAKMTGANIDTEFTAADLEKLGITRGKQFQVTFNEKTFTVLLGASYFDVKRGEWVAFVKADGYLKIARNFDSVIILLGCKAGDEIFIKPMPEETK